MAQVQITEELLRCLVVHQRRLLRKEDTPLEVFRQEVIDSFEYSSAKHINECCFGSKRWTDAMKQSIPDLFTEYDKMIEDGVFSPFQPTADA